MRTCGANTHALAKQWQLFCRSGRIVARRIRSHHYAAPRLVTMLVGENHETGTGAIFTYPHRAVAINLVRLRDQ